jgi:thiamine biosynthesis lipoprotein
MAGIRLATQAMGTRFELVAFGPDPVALRAAGEAAIEAIEDAHRQFSRFESSSLLSHIRRVGPTRPVPLDPDTCALLADALAVRRASGGRFDITLGTGGAQGGIALDPPRCEVRLTDPAVELDLGGIAKGHGIDLGARALRDAGVRSAFLQGGRSSGFAIGQAPGGRPWRVALGEEDDAPVVDLVDEGFAVSASLRSPAEGLDPDAHLVDPIAQEVFTRPGRAAVAGPSARLADAWATALVLLEHRPVGLGGEWRVWIRRDGDRWRSLALEAAGAGDDSS